jgi:hypothetical protein
MNAVATDPPAGTTERVFVLERSIPQECLSKVFEPLGWQTIEDLPAPESQPVEECLVGQWTNRRGGHAELVDDGFILILHVGDAEQAELTSLAQLPAWTSEAVAQRLAAVDERVVIEGIRAAALMCDPALFAPLARLRHRPEEAVRVEAVAAMQQMLPTLLSQGSCLLREAAAQQQGAHPLWIEFSPAWLRRQILRWLLNDNTSASPGVESVLRAALADPDWEVRVGAVIGVTRWRVRSLAGLVEQCALPSVSRDGPDVQNRALLRELRRVACALLAGRVPPVLDEHASPKLQVMERLAQCLQVPLAAQDVTDHIALMVHALTTPVPSVPPQLCDGAPSMSTVWVPDGPAFRGDGLSGSIELLQVAGFHVAVDPVEAGAGAGARLLSVALVQSWLEGQAGRWRLPTVTEWLSTVRGNDGRLYPWGNGWQHDAAQCPGPWSTWGHGEHPEWAVDASGSWCRCGPLPYQVQSDDGLALLRPVLLQRER